jgi:hypothetical protein
VGGVHRRGAHLGGGIFERLNEGALDGSEDWAAYLSPRVIDHNKIIFGEADEPGAAIEGFRQQLAAFGPAGAPESGLLVQEDRA